MSQIPISPLHHPNSTLLQLLTHEADFTTSREFLDHLTNASANATYTPTHDFTRQLRPMPGIETTAVFWMYGVLILIIAVLGIFANISVVIVMNKPQMRSCVNTLLSGLALFDAFLLAMCLLIYTPMPYCSVQRHKASCNFVARSIILTYPLSLIAHTGSVWTCVAIAADRYIALSHPLKVRAICTVSRAVKVLLAITLFSIVYNFPTFFELEITQKGIRASFLRESDTYKMVYKAYAYLIIMILIPVLAMTLLNIISMRALRLAYRSRAEMTGRDEKERRISLMVILVITCFILFNFLAFVTHVIEGMVSSWKDANPRVFTKMIYFANLFVVINSAVNFLIYCLFGHRFRDVFYKTFCGLCIDYRYSRVPLHSFHSVGKREPGEENFGIVEMRRMPSDRIHRKRYKNAQKGIVYTDAGLEMADWPKTAV